ncbi:hypothetical protein K438DRAFT_1959849 [Mycena galopus ATCC 62051]|nr:hypothetical protein K438DRAFT_1959849 [Mycena galopus ATCC 62051]
MTSASFIASAVKNLWLSVDHSLIQRSVIAACGSMQDLSVGNPMFPEDVPILNGLVDLKCLSVAFSLLPAFAASSPPLWLNTLTHLHLHTNSICEADISALAQLRSLSHQHLALGIACGLPYAEIACGTCAHLTLVVVRQWCNEAVGDRPSDRWILVVTDNVD